MSHRETTLQLEFVALAVLLSVLWVQFGAANTFSSALYIGVFYVVVFAGTHIVLALRGDGGGVPVGARWRFVALVGAAAAAMGVGVVAGPATLAGVTISEVLGPTGVVLFVAYWLYEAREGTGRVAGRSYRSTWFRNPSHSPVSAARRTFSATMSASRS